MPQAPLSDGFSAVLRSDSSAALAALMVIANAHRDLMAWFLRTIFGDASAPALEPRPRASGAGRVRNATKPPKPNGHGEARGATTSYSARRLTERDKADQALVEAMRDDPAGTLGAWAEAISRSRSSVITGLQRLRDAGLAESAEGKWRLTEELAPKPRWTKPLSGAEKAPQVHLTAS